MLLNEVRDPRVALLTVSDVSLTKDRRIARIYIQCHSSEEDLQEGLAGLESARGYLRSRLGQLLGWRFSPEIEFRIDRSWEQGEKMDRLFDQLEQDRREREQHADPE